MPGRRKALDGGRHVGQEELLGRGELGDDDGEEKVVGRSCEGAKSRLRF